MSHNAIGIIPARYQSSRFPGKPLVEIEGKSMIRRVYEQASMTPSLNEVWVATDDERIYNHVRTFGGQVLMTSSLHASGTDRCYEALGKVNNVLKDIDLVVNIQGDEPFIDPKQIELVLSCFTKEETSISTLVKKITSQKVIADANVVKAVFDANKRALYFTRCPVPYCRDIEKYSLVEYFKHIGIYAYRTDVLARIVALPPSTLEIAESLEQLRWLENGFPIHVEITDLDSFSVDTPEDLLTFH